MEAAASIAGLIAVATQITDLLTRFVSAAHQAPTAISFLTSEVTTFTHVLTTIPTLSLPSLDTHLSSALAAARTTLTELQTELTRMTSAGGTRFWERVRYASSERALTALVDRLCCHKLTLLLCLNVLARSDNAGCNDATRRGVAELTQMSAAAPPPAGAAAGGASSASLALAAYQPQPAAAGAGASTATIPAAGYTPFYYYSLAQPYYSSTPMLGARPSPAPYFPYNYTPTPPAATQTAPYFSYYRAAFPLTPFLFNPSYAYSNRYYPYQQPPQYPLHAAIDRRDTYTLSYLLSQRHSTSTTHPTYGPPLAYAVAVQHAPSVAVLLLWGADVMARSESGKSLLHFAAELGDEVVVGYLLARGAAVGDLDGGGNTPLAVAAGAGRWGVVGMLRAWGAAA